MLREEMERANLKQGEFAQLLGIHRPLVNRIVKGEILPNRNTAERMCQTLKQPILRLFPADDINLFPCGSEFAKNDCIQAETSDSKRKETRRAKKLTVRLSETAAAAFQPERLRVCGFHSQTELIHAVARWLNQRYAEEKERGK